jgi:serine/threonine protein kinase
MNVFKFKALLTLIDNISTAMGNAALFRKKTLSPDQTAETRSGDKKRSSMDKESQYRVMSELGRGIQSIVYKAESVATQKIVAMKRVICMNSAEVNKALEEVRQLTDCRHPNVVNILDFFMNDQMTLSLILECCSCNLEEHVKKYYPDQKVPESDLKAWSEQILGALSFFHAKDIVHRDIKTRNSLCS